MYCLPPLKSFFNSSVSCCPSCSSFHYFAIWYLHFLLLYQYHKMICFYIFVSTHEIVPITWYCFFLWKFPIKFDTLILGSIFISIDTSSGHAFIFHIFASFHLHNFLNLPFSPLLIKYPSSIVQRKYNMIFTVLFCMHKLCISLITIYKPAFYCFHSVTWKWYKQQLLIWKYNKMN